MLDVWDTGIDNVLFEHRRAHHRAIAREFIRTLAHWRYAEQDRVIPVIYGFNAEYRSGFLTTRIMARPFAKGTFDHCFLRIDIAFQDYFRIGREGEASDFTLNKLHWLAAQAPDDVELKGAIGRLSATEIECKRIAA